VLNKVPLRAWLFWAILIVLGIVVFNILTDSGADPTKIQFSEFREAARDGKVDSVEVQDLQVDGTFTDSYAQEAHDGTEKFHTVGPVGEDLQDVLMSHETEFTFVESNENSLWKQILVTSIPLLLLVVVLVFIMRQFQSGGGKAMSFGKSTAQLLNESDNTVTFNDIAGIEEAKEELQEIIEFLKNPKKFTRLGGRIPKGVILMGAPGTGKTLLARGVAGEAGVPFYSISGSDFVEMFVGVGASRVRDLFEQGKENAPCIIFIDEIDAVGRNRGAGVGGGHDEREQTLNQLLVEMDGFESNEGVVLIAATNRPDVLDPALLRPGRFDRRIKVPPPDVRGREEILDIHTRRTPVGPDVDLSKIARGTPGFSGADLENLVNEAALMAARRDKDRVEREDFEDAKDKVLMGVERKSAVVTDEERRVTAYHEAGHALVAMLQDCTDPVHKVTIIPRGQAMGVTQQLPEDDRNTMKREYVEKRISVTMGGRSAEEVAFDEITTGAGNDIDVATDMARKMVCEWGMSDRIGPLSYSSDDGNQPFVGQEGVQRSRPYSESVAKKIDAEVRRIVTEQHQRAVQLLRDNYHLLELMAEALLEFEALDSEEIEVLLEAEELDAVRTYREQRSSSSEESDERVPKTEFESELKDKDEESAEEGPGSIGDLEPST
jgi:cell division protease FtsH